MVNVELREIVWSVNGVTLPMEKKVYRLSHIQFAPMESASGDDTKMYVMSLSRSGEALCYIKVVPSEMDDFKALQNLVFNSKLQS